MLLAYFREKYQKMKYTKNKKMICRIYDIFGVVTNPYISITLDTKSERTYDKIIGKDLYLLV